LAVQSLSNPPIDKQRNIILALLDGTYNQPYFARYCDHFVLNSTSLQLIPAYSSQSSCFGQTLAGVGLSELE
jgi:hypothetical protein